MGRWTRSSTEDCCLYSLYKMCEIIKEIDQELHRGLLLIFFIESLLNQKGNKPGAPPRASAYKKSIRKQTRSSTGDFCLHSLLKVYEISEQINQELHGGLLLAFLGQKRKSTRSSTADFCRFPSSKLYESRKEMNQELHRGLLLTLPIESVCNQ